MRKHLLFIGLLSLPGLGLYAQQVSEHTSYNLPPVGSALYVDKDGSPNYLSGFTNGINLFLKTNKTELMKHPKLYVPPQEVVEATLEKNVAIRNVDSRLDEFKLQDTTRELVTLVKNASELLNLRGEEAFNDLRIPGSRWRSGETYIFVLDPEGNMLVHPDPELEGKNQLELKDINGKPIIRGLLNAATTLPDKPEGWYHYEWPVPDGLLPRWKSSYVQLVKAPSGKSYVVGSGMYNDRMEREFVVDAVIGAVGEIEKRGKTAFELFYDPTGPYRAKDAYIFVIDPKGVDLVNPAFPNLEGHNKFDLKDTEGKFLIREMLKVVQTSGSGWVDYMWPKPGESVSTQKSTYVRKAKLGDSWVVVGCGVYLADAPKAVPKAKKMTAPELMLLVRDAAAVMEKSGEKAFPEFRQKGFRWFHDDTYFFVWNLQGTRVFHAADPQSEGENVANLKDILGRPLGKMFLEAAATPAGEGWVHYMWPEPGDIFPAWKSSFVKRIQFPSGKQFLVGCGIYNMQMDKTFIEDVVNRAAALVAERGQEAFPLLRDKTGPFVFMDTYVFVDSPEGIELVNPAQPSIEGKNLMNVRDAAGKLKAREYIEAALKKDTAWIDYLWYKPGENKPAKKLTFVRKVQHGNETYVVGAGLYAAEEEKQSGAVRKVSWKTIDKEKVSETITRQVVFGEKGTVAQVSVKSGAAFARHSHMNEEYFVTVSGAFKFTFDNGQEYVVNPDEVMVIPSNVPHSIMALKDGVYLDFFAPVREDWLQGKDQYMRQ